MNKRIARLLRTNITIFSLCLVLFALAAIPFDVRLAIGEGVAAVAFFLLGRRRSKATQQSLRQYIQRFYGGMDSARSSNMLFTPLPMMVFDLATEDILWSSESFLQLTEQREGIFDAHLETVFPNISFHWLLEGRRRSHPLDFLVKALYHISTTEDQPRAVVYSLKFRTLRRVASRRSVYQEDARFASEATA